jgi:excisionase family DNA binding protein
MRNTSLFRDAGELPDDQAAGVFPCAYCGEDHAEFTCRHKSAGKPPRLLTTEDVARIFQCSPDTVERLARAGELPFLQLRQGGHRRYTPEDVQGFVKRRRREAAAPTPRVLTPPRPYTRKKGGRAS